MLKIREEEFGLTRIELVIVLLMIAISSSVAISYVKGRANVPKWDEGKAIAASIRTAADNYRREKGSHFDYSGTTLKDLGFTITPGLPGGDLDAKYFTDDSFSIHFSKNGDYWITIDAAKSKSGDPPASPQKMVLNHLGQFTEMP
jgi:type II secretory pathway pseudopilin PulG